MLVIDDSVDTGGTLRVVGSLLSEAGYDIAGFACVVDISQKERSLEAPLVSLFTQESINDFLARL